MSNSYPKCPEGFTLGRGRNPFRHLPKERGMVEVYVSRTYITISASEAFRRYGCDCLPGTTEIPSRNLPVEGATMGYVPGASAPKTTAVGTLVSSHR